ncbi:MAG: translocation/assembly module TamB domain-containing protein, partial [Ignavibacteria bacterium]
MNTDILVSNAQGKGRLRLTGDIPVENPFQDTAYTSIMNYPVNFKLNAKDFQINLLSRIIPNFAKIRGFLNGEIVSKGTVSEPILSGDMSISKGRFLLGITGLYYRFNTNLRTQNSDLIVERFQIFNEKDDRRHIDVYGRINFAGLKINDIDLSTSGDIVVLDESSTENELGFTGNMIAGVGSPPVTLKGNLEKLYLEGQFLIKSANLTFPSLLRSSYDVYDDNFVYRTITDTAGTEFRDTIIVISSDKLEEVDPFLRSRYVSKAQQKSSITKIIYDLNVKTTKNAYVKIKVNEATKEELFGEISADIDIDNKTNNEMRAFGNVDFAGDSYYRFYRNFKVRDSKISFNGPPDNPELNIYAIYETKRTVQLLDNPSTEIVKVILIIKGNAYNPEFTLKLEEGGTEIRGADAQSDAISYLLFGVPKSQLSPGHRSGLAKNIGISTGSTFLSSLFSDAIRTIAPFIVNAEVSYTEGDLAKGTDVKITSEFGDAIVRLGGRVFSDLTNTEVSVEYPLNKLFDIDVSNNLVLEISRTADFNTTITGDNRTITTGIKILYII